MDNLVPRLLRRYVELMAVEGQSFGQALITALDDSALGQNLAWGYS